MRIVVAAPIRDRAWALPSWLGYLTAAAAAASACGHSVGFIFLENDSVDGTNLEIHRFADWAYEFKPAGIEFVQVMKHDYGYAHYKVPLKDRSKGLAEGELPNVQNDKRELAEMRNMIVAEFLETGARYLVMWDSDVWMPREALSGDPRSLVSTMNWRPEIATMVADTQHPSCGGLFHNAMVEVRGGLYNHPQRMLLQGDRIISMWVPDPIHIRRFPRQTKSMPWDQRKRGATLGAQEVLYLARVETTGGGGAAITRREAFLPPVNARYGAAVQGEDVPLCERIRNNRQAIALYSGIRGLHLTRKLFEDRGGVRDLDPYGEWVEDWIARTTLQEIAKKP